MVQLSQDRPAILGQSFDGPAFPQRSISIEASLHDIGDDPVQRCIIAGLRQRNSMHMMGEIELRVIDPFRRREVERMCAHHLGEPGNLRHPLGEHRNERGVVGSRPLHDGQAADRQTHMAVGILGLEEAGIKSCQVLHWSLQSCLFSITIRLVWAPRPSGGAPRRQAAHRVDATKPVRSARRWE